MKGFPALGIRSLPVPGRPLYGFGVELNDDLLVLVGTLVAAVGLVIAWNRAVRREAATRAALVGFVENLRARLGGAEATAADRLSPADLDAALAAALADLEPPAAASTARDLAVVLAGLALMAYGSLADILM